jgi:hypothetical protein
MAYPIVVQPENLVYGGLEVNLRGPSAIGLTTGGLKFSGLDGVNSSSLLGEHIATSLFIIHWKSLLDQFGSGIRAPVSY